ncbi:hypothetical protein HU200_008482 [Digitaria exilis]|uniref:Disease resistance protein winged helix domain-containing protein n=1 Tax=Digitaria exilis TaxID=1010633 RepID=A0A835KQ50_9POAL|nr:hypothetical protein HU200_008482 [Digitaria exilis]
MIYGTVVTMMNGNGYWCHSKKSQVQGNIIIATTRFRAQAQIMVKFVDHSICLQGLDHKEFNELFLDFVFGYDQSRKDHMFLLETGHKIVARLKGSPLAAKTVGRLLKKKLDLEHWTGVLESKEWEQSEGDEDIMPALKLSYGYLPSHQHQQCFFYSALFPQDYKFQREELINFWIGLDVLHPSRGENKRVEDIGLSHLTQLVNHGFFEERKENGSTFYTLHDLLHELAWKVSSHECISIDCSKVRSIEIPSSIRHLSIYVNDTSVQDRLSIKNCLEDFNTLLDKRLKVDKLQSLMLFGEHHGCFVKAFGCFI